MAPAEDAESCRNHQLVWPLRLGDSLTGGHGTFWEMDLSGKPPGCAGELAMKRMRIPARYRPPNAHDATGTRLAGSKPTTRRVSLATWRPRAKCRKVDRQEGHKADL